MNSIIVSQWPNSTQVNITWSEAYVHLVKCVDYFFVKYAPTDANRKRIGPFTMIPLTLERKRMEDEWEDAMSPLFSQYVSIFEAEYDRYGNKGCRIFKGGILFVCLFCYYPKHI